MTVVHLGQPIARGRTADIYAWETGYVLKLFRGGFDLEDIKYEAHLAQIVHASGLPVPRVGDIVHLNERYGLIYARVHGPSMLEALQQRPWQFFYYARRLAMCHAQLHAQVAEEIKLPPQRQRLETKIRHALALPPPLQATILSALSTLPGGNRICHGDFHPGNILLTKQGDVIIDWIDATLGNPLADVARSTLLLLGAGVGDHQASNFHKVFIRLFQTIYLHHYFSRCPGGRSEYQRWLPIVAAARLSEDIPEQESWLVAQAQKINQP